MIAAAMNVLKATTPPEAVRTTVPAQRPPPPRPPGL
jgi:hypothetical protein